MARMRDLAPKVKKMREDIGDDKTSKPRNDDVIQARKG